MNINLKSKDIRFFNSLIVKAGNLAWDIQKKGVNVQRKDDTSIVTEADLAVQDFLIKKIKKRYRDFHFIYEENFEDIDRKPLNDTTTVIIDPIDGTAMFSMYLPFWCVSIGIFDGYNPAYGFVFAPGLDMLFHNDNDNSYFNGVVKRINNNIEIDNETNIFYSSEIYHDYHISYPGKVRNLGSTTLHGCLSIDNARNRTLAFVGKSFIWDWAGLFPIVSKAGGKLKYITGKDIDYKEIFQNDYKIPDYLLVYNNQNFEDIKKFFIKI